MGDSQRGQPSKARENSDPLPNAGRQVGSSRQPHRDQSVSFSPKYSHIVPEQQSFPSQDATSPTFAGPYTAAPSVQPIVIYPPHIPIYPSPQLVHHPAPTGSFGTYSAPANPPLHAMQIPPYHPYASEQNMHRHPWAPSVNAAYGTVYSHFAPMSTSTNWGQHFGPAMNVNGPSIPQPYVFTSPQPHFPTNITTSGHGSSGQSESSTWWQFPSVPNASPTTGSGFHAHVEDLYRTSYGPARETESRPVAMPVRASHPPSPPPTAVPTRRISHPQPSVLQPTMNMQTTSPPLPYSPPSRSEPSTRPSLAPPPSTHSPVPVPRSQWAMWVGNVPADATNEELFRFFNQPHQNTVSDHREPPPSTLSPVSGGVISVFLIGRSNCAFVNFESQSQLESAAMSFNGRRLREGNSRGPRLICRVRKQDDDGHAGVNGQRQSNIHVQWLRERQLRTDETRTAAARNSSNPLLPISRPVTVDDIATQLRFLSRAVDADTRKQGSILSEDSYGSTTSSMLSKNFPRRFFILKSLTQSDLDESVRTGLWTTQPHNEAILNRAYRTSHSVYIIFGVNKSGEFYGYARMAGPIGSTSPLSSQPIIDEAVAQAAETFLLPTVRYRVDSPEVVDEEGAMNERIMSAPPELGPPRQQGSSAGDHLVADLAPTQIPAFSLSGNDNSAPPPYHAIASPVPHHPCAENALEGITEDIREPDEATGGASPPTEAKTLGKPFKVEWVRTDRLSFLRTRHLRNPWNHGRQIKVSRDGTELEPDVACELLEEWDRPPAPAPSTQNSPSRTKSHAPSQRRRSKASAGTTSSTPPP